MSNVNHPYPNGTVMVIIDPQNTHFNKEFIVTDVIKIGVNINNSSMWPAGTLVYPTLLPPPLWARQHACGFNECVPKYIPPEDVSTETTQKVKDYV